MATDRSYLKGNTRKLAMEWKFDFTVSNKDGTRASSTAIYMFYQHVLDVAVEGGFSVGGGCRPILDADYEAMDAEDKSDATT